MGTNEKMAQEPKSGKLIRLVLILQTLLAVWILSCTGVSAYTTFNIPAEYDQAEARNALALINEYRAENGVAPLSYDYRLESFAMQRAAEIGVMYEHTRPEGTPVTETLKTLIRASGTNHMSENIYRPHGECSASESLDAFKTSPAHNAAMLASKYQYVGFGYARVDRYWCWVQIFHSASSGESYSSPVCGMQYVPVNVDESLISLKGQGSSIVYSRVMEEEDLPEVYRMVGDVRFPCDLNWNMADTSVAEISGNKLCGRYPGTTALTATASNGESVSFDVQVSPYYLSEYSSSVTLPQSEYTYTGAEIKPQPVVKVNETALTAGTDYTVSYANNISCGYATITIEGKGRFDSSFGKLFEIKKAPQKITASVSPSTVTAGKQATIKCSGIGDLSYSSSNSDVAAVDYYGTVYTYKAGKAVITVTAGGDSNHDSASTTVTVTVKAAPSSPYCSLKAPVITAVKNVRGGISVKWKPVSGAAKYRVMVRKGKGTWRTVAVTKAKTYTWKKPVSGVRYYVTVRCVNSANRPSKYYNKTGKSTVYVKSPAITSAKSSSAKKLAVKWTKVSGAGGYQVYYRTGSNKAMYRTLKGAAKNFVTLTGLQRQKNYKVMVRAWKKISGKSYYSAWSSIAVRKIK